jgi:rare lipoprotein A
MRYLILCIWLLALSGCFGGGSYTPSKGTFKVGKPYWVGGKLYTPEERYTFSEKGLASWYGPGFQGKHTANGETFDTRELTGAHKTLQMPALVKVTNLDNGKSVVVRINDRGPYKRGRIIDLSQRAAELLEFKHIGTARVQLDVLTEESRAIAAAAMAGQNTRGYEMAYNGQSKTQDPNIRQANYESAYGAVYTPKNRINTLSDVQFHKSADQRDMPAPVVYQQQPVKTTLYIQAGAFSSMDNAKKLEAQLRLSAGHAFVITKQKNGQPIHHVRMGPYATIDEADMALARISKATKEKVMIVVDG